MGIINQAGSGKERLRLVVVFHNFKLVILGVDNMVNFHQVVVYYTRYRIDM